MVTTIPAPPTDSPTKPVSGRTFDTDVAQYMAGLDAGWIALWAPSAPTFTVEEMEMADR